MMRPLSAIQELGCLLIHVGNLDFGDLSRWAAKALINGRLSWLAGRSMSSLTLTG